MVGDCEWNVKKLMCVDWGDLFGQGCRNATAEQESEPS